MKGKSLIVNADDLGADRGRNEGILEGVRKGIIKAVGLLPNAPGSLEAIECLKALGLRTVSLGLHLNLSEGRPLCPDLERLVGEDGLFLGKRKVFELLTREPDETLKKEISREIEAQLEWIKSFGLEVLHANGHNHVHLLPAVLPIFLDKVKRYGILWTRLPLEKRPAGKKDPEMEFPRLVGRLASRARGVVKRSGLRVPDSFFGLYWTGRISVEVLEEVVKMLTHGMAELMVHPGRTMEGRGGEAFSPFSNKDREHELEALMDPRFVELLEKEKIELTGYPR